MTHIQYKLHLLLQSNYKLILTLTLQYGLVILLISLYGFDCASCMTNENDTGSEISSIFEYSDEFIQDMVPQGFEHIKTRAYRLYASETTDPVANAFGPMFEYYKGKHFRLDPESLDSTPLVEKIKMLEQDYFTTGVEKDVLNKALEDQSDQLIRRHRTLLETKETVKNLTQENLELKNQIDELQRLLSESLRK